jgi:hypothetical protein
MQGSLLSNAQLQDMSETVVTLGTLSGTVTINYALGSYQTLTTNGAVSLAFSNFSVAGTASTVVVQVTVSSVAHTLQIPAAVSINTQGIQGLNTATNTMEFATTGVYSFTFTTSNGGTTISLAQVNNILTPFNYSSQELNDTGAVSLATTASYFSTVAASTATLATGADGQIKTLIMAAYGGNMVITVASAGWKSSGSGTITFNAIGDACTLQYINSKWFCIGQNSVTFA